MIGIVDYGVGNLFSLQSSLGSIGAEVTVSSDEKVLEKADRLILPGVGAFGDAIDKLRNSKLDRFIIKEAAAGKDIMGICLGMQLLFESSFEYGEHKGLGLLKGNIVPMEGRIPVELKIPHIGWNKLDIVRDCHLFRYLSGDSFVYFVHSYFAENCEESLAATSEYGINLTAAVKQGNVMGCQFHPEKSGSTGLSILKAFCEGEKTC